MRHVNDCPVLPCALLTVTLRSIGGKTCEQIALATLNEWTVIEAYDGRYQIAHVPTGLTAHYVTLTKRDALRVLAKLRDVHITSDTFHTIYKTVRDAFPSYVRKSLPEDIPLSHQARELLARSMERAA